MKTNLKSFILKSAKVVQRIALLIAAVGAAASYMTQVTLLMGYGMGLFSYVVPATIDLLAICAAIGSNIPQLPEKDKKYVNRVLTIAVLVSVTANVAGGHNTVTRIGHAWPVVAYLLAEGIANRLRTFAARLEADEATSVPQPISTPPVQAVATVSKPTTARVPRQMSAKARILELAAATPRPSDDEIAAKVGVKPGWVKHVVKTTQQ
jgi:hypothetical protein